MTIVIIFGCIYLVFYSIYLLSADDLSEKESVHIFIEMVCGAFAFGVFGWILIPMFLVFYIPVKLIDFIRCRNTFEIEMEIYDEVLTSFKKAYRKIQKLNLKD